MASYANDRDVKDAKIIIKRVKNIKKLLLSLSEKHYSILTVKDEADLHEALEAVECVLLRYCSIN